MSAGQHSWDSGWEEWSTPAWTPYCPPPTSTPACPPTCWSSGGTSSPWEQQTSPVPSQWGLQVEEARSDSWWWGEDNRTTARDCKVEDKREKNRMAVKKSREKKNKEEIRIAERISFLKEDNRRTKNNIDAMHSQLKLLKNIVTAHDTASGGAVSRSPQGSALLAIITE